MTWGIWEEKVRLNFLSSQWHRSIGDAALADAILDRLLRNSHKIKLKGESMRKAMTKND